MALVSPHELSALSWIVDIAMTFSERGCLLHFINIGNYKFLLEIELNFKTKLLANYEITSSCQTECVAQAVN